MAFYPGMTLGRLRKATPEEKQLLTYHMHRLMAQRRLEFISDVASAMSGEEDAREHRVQLAMTAYRDDPRSLARAIVILRRSN